MRRVSVLLLGLACSLSFSARADAPGGWGARDDWPMYNHDVLGTRVNPAEQRLSTRNVAGLHVLWSYATPAPVYGTPAVHDGHVFVGDTSGMFYALTTSGQLLWKTQLTGQITASALVYRQIVIFGDLSGNVYGLREQDGHVLWTLRADPHPQAAIYGSAIPIGDSFAIGVASNEEGAAAQPGYPCCSSRGSVLRARARDGHVLWQTSMLTDAERAAGASGASVWSTPTYCESEHALYVTTGNNFSAPSTSMSDAFVALDADTGAVRWVNQRTMDDIWNGSAPPDAQHPDYDFGDSAQLYQLPNGRRVVGAGQKSGFYFALDAVSGALIHQVQLMPGGPFGGLFADSAVLNDTVFANGNDWPNPQDMSPPIEGDIIAISGDGAKERWRFTVPGSANVTGLALANGVLYFSSAVNGELYALDAATGKSLAAVQIGATASGPSIAGGHVYLGTGPLTLQSGSSAPGSVVALGL